MAINALLLCSVAILVLLLDVIERFVLSVLGAAFVVFQTRSGFCARRPRKCRAVGRHR